MWLLVGLQATSIIWDHFICWCFDVSKTRWGIFAPSSSELPSPALRDNVCAANLWQVFQASVIKCLAHFQAHLKYTMKIFIQDSCGAPPEPDICCTALASYHIRKAFFFSCFFYRAEKTVCSHRHQHLNCQPCMLLFLTFLKSNIASPVPWGNNAGRYHVMEERQTTCFLLRDTSTCFSKLLSHFRISSYCPQTCFG